MVLPATVPIGTIPGIAPTAEADLTAEATVQRMRQSNLAGNGMSNGCYRRTRAKTSFVATSCQLQRHCARSWPDMSVPSSSSHAATTSVGCQPSAAGVPAGLASSGAGGAVGVYRYLGLAFLTQVVNRFQPQDVSTEDGLGPHDELGPSGLSDTTGSDHLSIDCDGKELS